MELSENQCPSCAYDLGFRAWDSESPSLEICPSCGIQFGYDDMAGGDVQKRKKLYVNWKAAWNANERQPLNKRQILDVINASLI